MPPKASATQAKPAPSASSSTFQLPLVYSLFFLFIEPLSALLGVYFAHFRPADYLALIDHTALGGATDSLPTSTRVALSQLGNLYLLFTLNEALVLRSTGDLRVWKTVLFCLLIADLGHLYSCWPLGARVYYDVWWWNAIDLGSVPFVYAGAGMRIAFLLGVGLGGGVQGKKAKGQ